jgi:hypothetical protein
VAAQLARELGHAPMEGDRKLGRLVVALLGGELREADEVREQEGVQSEDHAQGGDQPHLERTPAAVREMRAGALAPEAGAD